jgi:single-stranded DNA-binding protein
MSYVQKDGQGSLFKNDRKEKDTHPDYKGSILINGQEFWLSAWIKEGAKGKFMSLSAQPKEQQRAPAPASRPPAAKPASGFDDMDDDIPF